MAPPSPAAFPCLPACRRCRRRSLATAVAAALLALGGAGLAPPLGAQEWQPIGPNGGPLREIAQAPGAPDVLYAVTRGGGIFRSTDHGRDWQLAGDALNGQDLEDLVVDPRDPLRLYAAVKEVGVGVSADGGATWTIHTAGLPEPNPLVLVLAADPAAPGRLLAGTFTGLFQSADHGATWTALGGAIAAQAVYALLFDAVHPGTVYAGALAGGFFKSTDGGATWTASNAGLPPGTPVYDLAADPGAPATLYATAYGQVFRSDDGGGSWTAGAHATVDHLAVAPNGWLFGIGPWDVYRSTDRGATWVATGIPSPVVPEHGRALIADPATTGLIFAAATSGLLASASYGTVWRSASRGLTGTTIDRVVIAAGAPATVYASVEGLGVVGSKVPAPGAAGGALDRPAWQPANGNLAAQDQDAGTALAVDPRHPTILWRGTFFDAAWSGDGGATWTLANIPDDCMIVFSIALDPVRSSTVYLFGGSYENTCDTRDSHSWKTADGGAVWKNLPLDGPWLLIDPSHPTSLYAFGSGLSRSDDGGATWQLLPVRGKRLAVADLALDPARTAIAYAATPDGVFKSTNRGATWSRTGSGLPAGNVAAVAVDPRHPALVYAAVVPVGGGGGAAAGAVAGKTGDPGVYLSTDGGATWSPYGAGLPAAEVTGLVLDAADPGRLYALTAGYGLYRLAAAAPPR